MVLLIQLTCSACSEELPEQGEEPECRVGADCPPSSICREGRCLSYLCEAEEGPDGGALAGADGGALAGAYEGEGCYCDERISCPEGLSCALIEARCVPQECSPARPCGLGRFCQGGLCVVDEEEDQDADQIPDALDNCPSVANSGQEDADGDGIGDLCDPSCFMRAGPCAQQEGASITGQITPSAPCAGAPAPRPLAYHFTLRGFGRWGVTSPEGSLSLPNLIPGEWTLLAYPRRAPGALEESVLAGTPVESLSLSVAPEDLNRSLLLDGRLAATGALAGRVLLSELIEARINAPGQGAGGVLVRTKNGPVTLTDPSGYFLLKGLPGDPLDPLQPRATTVLISAPGYLPLELDTEVIAGRQRLVAAPNGGPLILRRAEERSLRTIAGTVELEGRAPALERPPTLWLSTLEGALPAGARHELVPLEEEPAPGLRFGSPSRVYRFSVELPVTATGRLFAQAEGYQSAFYPGLEGGDEAAPAPALLLPRRDGESGGNGGNEENGENGENEDWDGCEGERDDAQRDPTRCQDLDGDGLGEAIDFDDDGDGLSDLEELRLGWDGRLTHPKSAEERPETTGPLALSAPAERAGYRGEQLLQQPPALSQGGRLPLAALAPPFLVTAAPDASPPDGGLSLSLLTDQLTAGELLKIYWRDARCPLPAPGERPEQCPGGELLLSGAGLGGGLQRFTDLPAEVPLPEPGEALFYWLAIEKLSPCAPAPPLQLCAASSGLEEQEELPPLCLQPAQRVSLMALFSEALRRRCGDPTAPEEEQLRWQRLSCLRAGDAAASPGCLPGAWLSQSGHRVTLVSASVRWNESMGGECPTLTTHDHDGQLSLTLPTSERLSPACAAAGLMIDGALSARGEEPLHLRLPIELDDAPRCLFTDQEIEE